MKNESIATSYCINIPEGATNGDVIKAMFPKVRPTDYLHITETCTLRHWRVDDNITIIETTNDWWNAPYKAESEDKE